MSELDQLRQEAEGLRKKIRVSSNGACCFREVDGGPRYASQLVAGGVAFWSAKLAASTVFLGGTGRRMCSCELCANEETT